MQLYTTDSAPSTGDPQVAIPAWIIFRAGTGKYETRIPVEESTGALWRYVLDMTSLGFRADRVGDAIVITGRPSDMEAPLS